MHFEVDMKMDLRRLVALNALAEKTFRRGQMLLFRLVMLALGGWLSWTAGRTLLAEGIRFDQTCKLLTGLLVLAIGLFTNTISAWLNQMTIIPDGKLSFGEKFFTEKSKYQKTQHRYSDIFALKSYRGYDFIFLDKQRSLILAPDGISGGTPEELRRLIEEKSGKQFESVK